MSDVTEITTLDALVDAQHDDRAIIDFARRHGCVPCARLEPHFTAAAPAVDANFYKVLLDEVDEDLLKFVIDVIGVKSTPTVLEYRSGSVHGEVKGRTAPQIIKELSE